MGQAEIYPFATIGQRGQRYPDWIRELNDRNGVYLIRELDTEEIAYVGESHSERLYGTLTRHFQYWSPRFETAGPTYERPMVEVAVILVPKTHAPRLQNDLICALEPRDNRLVCDPDFGADDEDSGAPPRGYDYDIVEIVQALSAEAFEDVPF